MKKLTKKLSLKTQTVRVLSSPELDAVGGAGGGVPTTTIFRVSANGAVTAPCRLTGGVHTAPCRYTL
jgi:hypothetical protein